MNAMTPDSLPNESEIKRSEKEQDIDRQQDRDRDQEADQKLECGAGIFEVIAGDLGVAPEKATDVSRQPKTIDAERARSAAACCGSAAASRRGLSPVKRMDGCGRGNRRRGARASRRRSLRRVDMQWSCGREVTRAVS